MTRTGPANANSCHRHITRCHCRWLLSGGPSPPGAGSSAKATAPEGAGGGGGAGAALGLALMAIQCPFDPAPDLDLLWPWPWLDHSWLKVGPEMIHSNQQVQVPSQPHENLVGSKEDAVEWHQMHLGHHVTSQP